MYPIKFLYYLKGEHFQALLTGLLLGLLLLILQGYDPGPAVVVMDFWT